MDEDIGRTVAARHKPLESAVILHINMFYKPSKILKESL